MVYATALYVLTFDMTNFGINSTESRLNELLIKCISFRKKVAHEDLQRFVELERKEAGLKQKLLTKNIAVINRNDDDFIKVDLRVEKFLESKGPFPFYCHPQWTIWTTKRLINKELRQKLYCPVEQQHIVYGDKVVNDSLTLWECGVRENNSVLFVYVTSISELNDEVGLSHSLMNTSAGTSQLLKSSERISISDSMESPNTTIADDKLDTNEAVQIVQVNQKYFVGWDCTRCTYRNEPTRPGCLMCAEARPGDYKAPAGYTPSQLEKVRMLNEEKAETLTKLAHNQNQQKKKEKRRLNYESQLNALTRNVFLSDEVIECSICLSESRQAIRLIDCLHMFCVDCLVAHITLSEEVRVRCPYVDDNYACPSFLQDREIRELLSSTEFQKYLSRSLAFAEKQTRESFHCKTPDCSGWCIYEDGVNIFHCPVCDSLNCLTCKAIHQNKNCKEYQQQLKLDSATDKQAQKNRVMLENLLKQKEAMHCPCCNIIILKKDGCDWLQCTMCKTEICWVTKGPRWGPEGKGDRSGGCHCKEGGKKCHPKCINCH